MKRFSLVGATSAPFDTLRKSMKRIRGHPPEYPEFERRIAARDLERAASEVGVLFEDLGPDETVARITPLTKSTPFIAGKMKDARLVLGVLNISVLDEGTGKWLEKTITLEDISQVEIYKEESKGEVGQN